MRRFFNLLLGALAMVAVALLSAFLTMRLAIHGREVEVPSLAGLTVAEARSLVAASGLNLSVESHFYSTVTPAGRVLSQYPAPGTKVRHEWVVRVTESIGPQRVSVPNVIGKTEREATVIVRRLSLDLGTVAYIAAPGPPGIVLSQTPTPAATGVDGPRISLLVSEPLPSARPHPGPGNPLPDTGTDTRTAPGPDAPPSAVTQPAVTQPAANQPAAGTLPAATPEAFVMPDLVGLTLSAANARVAAVGLRIASVETVSSPISSIPPPTAPGAPLPQAAPRPIAPIAPITLANTVIAQTPAAGRRVTQADPIRITLSR